MRARWLEVIHRLSKTDKRIVFVGSDLSANPAFERYRADFPDRFFMEGVSEAYIVGMCAGLAKSGKIPYFNTIATFTSRRAFEQNVVDLGLARTKVRLLASGGGLVYTPLGPTHLAIEDLAIMSAIPHMAVVAPADADEMERAIVETVDHAGPIYFRVAKGGDPVVSRAEHGFKLGKAIIHRNPATVTILTTGIMLQTALAAADTLAGDKIGAGVIHFHTIKPFDRSAALTAAHASRVVLTLEEHVGHGGLGSLVAEAIAEEPLPRPVRFRRLALPDEFPDKYGSQAGLLDGYGLGPAGVVAAAKALL